MMIILFIILVIFITEVIWENMNDGNDPKNVPHNKFLYGYMKLHFKHINMMPTYKEKMEAYIMKYGYSILVIIPIIAIMLMFIIIYFEFGFNILYFLFGDSHNFKWFTFYVTLGTFLFGVHKYHSGNSIIIGTDVATYINNVKVQFISRTPNAGFVKLISNIELFKDGGLILDEKHMKVKVYEKWNSYSNLLSNYKEWQCIKGYELKEFIIMNENNKSNMEEMIKFAKCFAIITHGSDENLSFSISYKLNHKNLSRSVRISVDDIEKKALENTFEPSDLEIQTFKETYLYHY